MKKIVTILLITFCSFENTLAQDLAAYTDYMGRFYIFDKGKSLKIEDQAPQSFKIGGNCVLYVNSSGHFNMYSNGKVETLEKSGVTEYSCGDYLSAYSIFEKLVVISNGRKIVLSNRCPNYYAADSLIAFYDKNEEALKIFYNNKTVDIESGMLGSPIKSWSCGDNIFAYISARTGDFKIWYNGAITEVARYVENTRFKAGRNIVAFNSETEQNFQVFYKGELFTLEDFQVQSYKTGDDFVAYVNQNGDFKVFFEGEITTISTFAPQKYMADDNILAYSEDNRFKIWNKGNVLEIEAFVPNYYKLDWNTLAYLDNSNRIWFYQNGERKFLANEFVNSFDVYRDLISLNVKLNRTIIYYMGNFYEGQSFYK